MDLGAIVEMRGADSSPAAAPARLLEVAIHHVDLDIGYEMATSTTRRRVAASGAHFGWVAVKIVRDFSDLGFRFTTAIGSVGDPVAAAAHIWSAG